MPTGGDMSWQGGWDSMASVKAPLDLEPVVHLEPVVPPFLRAGDLVDLLVRLQNPSGQTRQVCLLSVKSAAPGR